MKDFKYKIDKKVKLPRKRKKAFISFFFREHYYKKVALYGQIKDSITSVFDGEAICITINPESTAPLFDPVREAYRIGLVK